MRVEALVICALVIAVPKCFSAGPLPKAGWNAAVRFGVIKTCESAMTSAGTNASSSKIAGTCECLIERVSQTWSVADLMTRRTSPDVQTRIGKMGAQCAREKGIPLSTLRAWFTHAKAQAAEEDLAP